MKFFIHIQISSDRAVSAERELKRMHLQLKQAEKTNAQLQTQLASSKDNLILSKANHQSTLASLSALKTNESAAITLLQNQLTPSFPLVPIQGFVNQVLVKYTVDGKVTLKTKGYGRNFTYQRVKHHQSLKANAKPCSRIMWLRKRMMEVMKEVGMHGEEVVIEILHIIAKKHGMLFAHQSDFELSVAQSMAVRDHVGTGTNGLARIKQAIELFCPALKGILLPSNIRRHVSIMERDGVVPSKIVQVCCTVNKKGNKRAMNTFYYCSRPSQLLENMISRMFMDNSFQKSLDFSSMSDV